MTNAAPRAREPLEQPPTLDARKAAILEAVVTEYIGSAQPVGSSHVAKASRVNVSTATIRSEMVALEHEGYLVQPHTSAGRIPTDKGYRFFVDHLAGPGVLGPAQRHQVQQFFDHVSGEMEEMLERASGLLSDLTACAAVVVGPSHDAATIRSVQVVGLGPHTALLVVVLSDGAVEKGTIELDRDVDENVLAAASRLLAPGKGRATFAEHAAPRSTGDEDVDHVASLAHQVMVEIGDREAPDTMFVSGPSRLAGAFEAVDTVRSVLSILEQQLVVVNLLRDVLGRGLSVAIGTEHGFAPLASCAVVVVPVSVDGTAGGAVGLLGPTRMDYPHALAAAHVVGGRLGERLRRDSAEERHDQG
jgi:heat-inducible transcriptional repressor